MAHLASCYFCGTALDDRLRAYAVVPARPDDDAQSETTVTLCPGCRRKLTVILDTAAAAADGDEPSLAPTEDATEPPDDGGAVNPADTEAITEDDPVTSADISALAGDEDGEENDEQGGASAESTTAGDTSETATDPPEAETAMTADDLADLNAGDAGADAGADGPPDGGANDAADDAGADGEVDGSPAEADADDLGSAMEPDVPDPLQTDEQPDEADTVDDAGENDDGADDGDARTAEDDGDDAETDDDSETATDDDGEDAAAGDAEADERATAETREAADDESDDGDDSPDAESTPQTTVSALEYNRVMRLLQNREFPVEREEIETVAMNAYDLSRSECGAVIDLAIDRGLIDERDGNLTRSD